MSVMYRANKNLVWEWLQVRGRKHFQHVVERRHAPNPALTSVRTHALVRTGSRLWTQTFCICAFFNISTATIRATSRLAKTSNAKVLMVKVHRNPQSAQWTVTLLPRLKTFSGDDHDDASRINQVLEANIRAYPAQYLWAHRALNTSRG